MNLYALWGQRPCVKAIGRMRANNSQVAGGDQRPRMKLMVSNVLVRCNYLAISVRCDYLAISVRCAIRGVRCDYYMEGRGRGK